MISEQPPLLILSGVQGDPRRYRTFHLFEQACLAGLSCELSHVTDPGLRKKVNQASLVILHRAAYDSQIDWIERVVHKKGGILVNDLDDLVFDPQAVNYIHSPDFADPIRRSLYQEDILRFRKTLEISDAAITSSEFLAGAVRQLGKPVYIHRNAFSLEMQFLAMKAYDSRKPDPGRVVIGYASGTPTHDFDFALVAPALKSCLSRHPTVELWLVGRLDPGSDWGNLKGQIKKISFIPWRNLPSIQVMFDINLAPLEFNNPFGQSKSENKVVETSLLRVPTIASPSDSYSMAISQGENGYLANGVQEWTDYLEALIEAPELRKNLGARAYQDILQRYHPEVRSVQLVDTLNLIAGHKFEFHNQNQNLDLSPEKSPTVYWSSAEQERFPTLFQRGLYTLRHRSIQTLIKQIWIFIRRLVSPIFPYRIVSEKDGL
jgi:glycosyltransferase involved in cell wall biosynthesis